jgi:hypothetical protein
MQVFGGGELVGLAAHDGKRLHQRASTPFLERTEPA